MGADLYVEKLDRSKQYLGFEVSKKAVEAGYFRDCYNSGGLFAFLTTNLNNTFSWWQFQNKKWFDKEGDMTVTGAKKFLKLMIKAKKDINLKDEFYLKNWEDNNLIKTNQNEVEYYKDWLDLLISFLELAINLKSKIIWSV